MGELLNKIKEVQPYPHINSKFYTLFSYGVPAALFLVYAPNMGWPLAPWPDLAYGTLVFFVVSLGILNAAVLLLSRRAAFLVIAGLFLAGVIGSAVSGLLIYGLTGTLIGLMFGAAGWVCVRYKGSSPRTRG